MVDIVILVLSVFVSLITGLFVFARNPRHKVNRIYALLTISLIIFSIANYFSLATTDRLFYIRTVIASTTIAIASLYYMILFLKGQNNQLSAWQKLGILFTLIVAVLDFTPLVFSGLQGVADNPAPDPNWGAALFVLHLLTLLSLSFVLLIRRAQHFKGIERLQYVYMLLGILPMFLLAPLTGFVLPVLLNNTSFIFLSPIYGTFFVCLVGYAIIKHRLFDIKVIIARSLGYVASILVLSMIYGFLFFGIAEIIFDLRIATNLEVFLSIATGVAALSFQNIKTVFVRLSNKLFYRDAYDSQDLFEHLNKILVSSLEINYLLTQTSGIINAYLKSGYCQVVLRGPGRGHRVFGANNNFNKHDLVKIYHLVSAIKENVIMADWLEEVKDTELQTFLQRNNIAGIIRLTSDVVTSDEGLGYMFIGAKRSGSPYTQQDIRVLDTIANELIITIQNALRFEEIEAFNVTLQQRVEAATKKLRTTNDKLRQLDQTKDDFISMASHQLRTPLTSVKGYVSMVLDGDAGEVTPLQRKLLNQSYISSQRMVYLISDLLNVSRLRTGKFLIEAHPTNLAKIIQDEIEQLQETAKGRNLELLYDKPDHFPTLMLDETKIRQVIMNFIDNAIYYTPSGGQITVVLQNKKDTVEFTVTDTGIGVAAHEQHHLFSKFFRAHNAKRARPDGTGLGLFMAKKVVVAQGGAVIFRSKEGKGSTFGFTFGKVPLLPPDPAKTPPHL